MSEQKSTEDLNNLIGEQVVHLITELHGEMRPFVLIFPPIPSDPIPNPQSLTNISNVAYLRHVLREHLEIAKSIMDFDKVSRPAPSLMQ